MFNKLLTKLFGSRNERVLRQYQKDIQLINLLEPETQALSDEALKAKTQEFKDRYTNGESLEKLLPEAFAICREASIRTLGLRHYDVQLIGGMVLNAGQIAEMRTGEGKTLVATLAVYLNALSGKGVHVVTVNDYLARRDAATLGELYNFLGLTVGVVVPGIAQHEKKDAYNCDITYGTNNEFGFDYLRDNMASQKEERFQRGLNFAIIDEVDSILIDEARTPLIISGPSDDSPDLYVKVNRIVPNFIRQEKEDSEGDYWVDEKSKQVHLSEDGMEKAEGLLRDAGIIAEEDGLYSGNNLAVVHHLNAALRANSIYQLDVDYIVRDGEVIIVDEFTGRTLTGRRWSDGLHQAVEAKEGVPIQRENQTLASITFQNYFRLYKKLSGMTGTADTEAYEFQSIYGLEVVVIPTHRPMIRVDDPDLVYLTRDAKFKAVIEDIKRCFATGQPVLVGTTSIDTSELLSTELKKVGIAHEVLNAKQHEREAHIVAQAGAEKSVTIATNMAGRGTDIVLGGSLEADISVLGKDADKAQIAQAKGDWQKRHDHVLSLGGLHIIGTERHESRRIDNQLRGRSGRQGDPGSSRFYLSLEDNLMRIFAADWVQTAMRRMGMKDDEVIESALVSRQIQNAQRKVESHNFDMRKNVLEYDDVANDQRKVIYQQRNELLEADDVAETIRAICDDVIEEQVRKYVPQDSIDEQWDIAGLEQALAEHFTVKADIQGLLRTTEELDDQGISREVQKIVNEHFAQKEAQIGSEMARHLEKHLMLNVLDQTWKEHLARMDYLRQGIQLRSYAQKQPKQEYKRESYELFSEMLDKVKFEVTSLLARVRVRDEEEVVAMEEADRARHQQQAQQMSFQHPNIGSLSADEELSEMGILKATGPKVGRNDPCPCGSGKKFKQCHGQIG